MKQKQKASAAHVKMLLKRSRMPRNQVAAISGLSNAYIRVLENGESASVAREKLISFAVALNLDLYETDELLTVFDRTKLTVDDIPNFINTSKQIKISSALLPLRDVFIIELMFLSIEWIPGHSIVVNDRPTAALRPEGYRTCSCKDMENIHPIHNELIEAIGRERHLNLQSKLTHYQNDNFICRGSLEEFILKCSESEERVWRIKHVETALRYLRHYDNFRIFLVDAVPSFVFSLKLPPEKEKKTDKITFLGKQIDFFMGKGSGRLAGFATDNQVLIENFKKEVSFLERHIVEEYLNKSKLEKYLENLTLGK